MANLPPLTALRAFEATARLGSLARAAAELHVTHGAISRQLQALEQAAGRPLLQRHGRGVVLTAAGQQLAGTATEAFSALRTGWQALLRERREGPLVLGCSASVLARWVIPRLARMQAELPGLRLHLAAQDEAPDAALSGLDAALLLAGPHWPQTWQVHVLARERIGPVLSPAHPLAAHLRAAGPQALDGAPLLQVASRAQAWSQWSTAVGLPPPQHFAAHFDHLYYLLEAAGAGLGVAIAPEPLVRADLTAGRLLAPWGFVPTDGHWLLAGAPRRALPMLPALADWLRRELAEPGAAAQAGS